MANKTFESLPDEILLEIFDYLSGYDLISSFYNINKRINSVIHGIQLDLDLSTVQQKTFLYTCYHILPKFHRQIQSIKLSNKQTIDGINYYIEQSVSIPYENIKKLVLIDPTREQLIKLLAIFRNLQILIIKTTDYLVIPLECISESLKICCISNCHVDLPSSNTNENIYSMEELNIKLSDMNYLFYMLHSMINMIRLTCQISENTSINHNYEIESRTLLFLNYLKLNVCSIPFSYIEKLVDLCPNLISFTYTYATGIQSTYDNEHIDCQRWNNLFSNKLKQIAKFDFHISLNISLQRDILLIKNQFQDLEFFQKHHLRIIYEITSYKHILCTIPIIKERLNTYANQSSLINAYTRIHHLDLVLNETIISQQQHKIRCPLVHSFYLGLYENITPIEQQSRLLLNQSISFVYLKHFELYGTCIKYGFVGELLMKMTNLISLTLPINHLKSCQINETIRLNMKRIKKLQIALTESLSVECVRNILIPAFPNLRSISFAIDNKLHSFNDILLTLVGKSGDLNHCFKYLMFIETFAIDQDWDCSILNQYKKYIRFRTNYRFLYVWL